MYRIKEPDIIDLLARFRRLIGPSRGLRDGHPLRDLIVAYERWDQQLIAPPISDNLRTLGLIASNVLAFERDWRLHMSVIRRKLRSVDIAFGTLL